MRVAVGMLFVGLWCGLLWSSEGKRPYELEWAGRVEDDASPLVDFEQDGEWYLETTASEATFEITNEQKIWGEKVGKLTYRYTPDEKQKAPKIVLRLLQPRPVDDSFDAISCWIYGNNWAWVNDPTTPKVSVDALFKRGDGKELLVPMDVVDWKEWFLVYRHLTDKQQELLHQPETVFLGFQIHGGRNTELRTLYWDNFAIRKEEWKPLVFQPRPQRGKHFPYQNPGLNTGEGRLPFPTRQETIAPENLLKDFANSLQKEDHSQTYRWQYSGEDGTLEYRFLPKTGTWSDIQVRWKDGAWFYPCKHGGVTHLALPGQNPQEIIRRELEAVTEKEGKVESRWKMWAGKDEEISATITYCLSILGKSLVLETISEEETVANLRHGEVTSFETAKILPIPYYSYGYNGAKNRPFAICLTDSQNTTLFLMSHVDWYASNGSEVYSESLLDETEKVARGNGGVYYHARTDGMRNRCYERFFLTVSPRFEEVLPTIPNPKSPWMAEMGKRQWRAHGAGNRENDKRYWYNVQRHGMTEVIVEDHEVGWRDGGESFTFRTKAAPGKGGDEGMRNYARFMQDTLGFLYGPYNNFTDFAPVNEFWSTDMISRTRENQLASAWARCYAPKPSRSVEYCEKLTSIIQEKFHFSTAYCDVHTAVAPWTRVDYDARVPGAGTFAATYYAFGEIMLLQKKGWNGPVYSEGPMHYLYSGLTDGNYAQDQGYGLPFQPWLVDFDLLKMHDLGCNFGMGNLSMFFSRNWASELSTEEKEASVDRFFAATLAFGHPGFLTLDFGMRVAMRGYFLLQPLHERYTVASVDTIRYLNAKGEWLDTSTAIATDDYKRSQLVVKYQDGTVICVNGSVDLPMATVVDGRAVELPPQGFVGWTADGKVYSFSALQNGKRCDYAFSPEMIYLDGRGTFQVFEKACGSGAGICRRMDAEHWEIIPLENAELGFAISAQSAVALNHAREEIGPAELRFSRGFTYVVPVDGAFSYRLKVAEKKMDSTLKCDVHRVLSGEKVSVQGNAGTYDWIVPAEAKSGTKIWKMWEEAWIDFEVVELCHWKTELLGNELRWEISPNLARYADIDVLQQGKMLSKKEGCYVLDLGKPQKVGEEVFQGAFSAKEWKQNWSIRVKNEEKYLDFPIPRSEKAKFWMQVRNQKPQENFGNTGAGAHFGTGIVCGGVKKDGYTTHPPYIGGAGKVWMEIPCQVPEEMPAVLRAFVGKRDGCDMGDGILYEVTVLDKEGNVTPVAKQHVARHEWMAMEADLRPWKGQEITLQLITDCGEKNNTSGDWGCWGDIRMESANKIIKRTLMP